jgi:sialidase-1
MRNASFAADHREKKCPVSLGRSPVPALSAGLACRFSPRLFRWAVCWLAVGLPGLALAAQPEDVARIVATGKPAEGGIEPWLGEAEFEIQQVFSGERFPNVVVAADGTVLATWGGKSYRVRRSEDGGSTWGPEITVAEPGFHGGGVVVDERSGDVLVFVEAGHPPAPLTVYRSKDHGKSWQADPQVVIHPDEKGNVPSMHMNEHGVTLRHGPHAGRLLRPTRSYTGGNARQYWPGHYTNAIYSDDGGKTWQTSAPFPALGTGEATLAELSTGRIYYNSRRHLSTDGLDPRRRYIAWSDDGGQTWADLSVSEELPDGDQNRDYGLMAGLVRLPVHGRNILIFSNIDSPEGRRRGTVWASFDGGRSWPVSRLVTDGAFAYSSLDAGRPGTASEGWIYLLYEGGGGGHMARFNLAWLLDDRDIHDFFP